MGQVHRHTDMNRRLGGSRTYISGGASGIGRACAERLAEAGSSVVIMDLPRSRDAAEETISLLRGRGHTAHSLDVDVTDPDQVSAAVAQATEAIGPPDVVITAAGVATAPGHDHTVSLMETKADHWRFVMDVNVSGTLNLIRETTLSMMDNSIPGSVVTLSSVAALNPTRGVYSVSKASVWMMTRVLARELAPCGIRVNSIAPGSIDTPMLPTTLGGENFESWTARQVGRIPLGRLGTASDVASAALFLASEDSSYITGSMIRPDGGLTMGSG